MKKIAVIVLSSLVVITIFILIYAQLRKKQEVRESYAFKCLASIVTLVGLAIAAVSSRQGLGDQIFGLIAEIFGHPVAADTPAPVSEKALIIFLVAFAVHTIYNSHKTWSGAISAEEVNRIRMQHSNSLLYQAFEEGKRIVKKKPKQRQFTEETRIDPVAVPDEPNLVWYDRARELFELWMPLTIFLRKDMLGWDAHSKCWIGENRRDKSKIFLFCVTEHPSDIELQSFSQFAGAEAIQKDNVFVVYKNENGTRSTFSEKKYLNRICLLSEEYLYSVIVDFSDYFTDIQSRVEDEFFPGTDITLEKIYVPSAVTTSITDGNIKSENLGQYLSSWASKPAGRQIAILGEYGQGKSTAALMFAYEAIKSGLSYSGGRIPIVLELRGKSPVNLSTLEMLAAWGHQYRLQASALMRLLVDGRLILILEGFDEMSNVSTAEARIGHFRSLWQFSYPKSKIIFTGRRNLFFEDKELQVVFKDSSNGSINGFCEALYLKPFDIQKIKQSLRWTDALTSDGIVSAAQSNSQILDIVSRPSLLFIVASLWSELGQLLVNGRLTSAQVIDKFILHSYERQEAKEKDLNFMALTTTERRFFHEGLAVYIGSHEATNQITNTDLTAAIERLYATYPDGINVSPNVALETSRAPLKSRIEDYEDAISAICTDVRTHGILVNDVGQRDAFRFAHKSFYEVLVAKAHASILVNIEPIFYNAIKSAMGGNIGYPYRYPEITKFFSEILMMHVRPTHDTALIPMAIYDLISKYTKKDGFFRRFCRFFQFGYLRFKMNEKVWNRLVLALHVVFLTSIAWRTDIVSSFVAHYPLIADYRWVPTPAAANPSYLVSAALVTAVIFVAASNIFSSILTRRVELWAAVLLASDKSMQEHVGRDAIEKYLGKKTSEFLVRSVRRKYLL